MSEEESCASSKVKTADVQNGHTSDESSSDGKEKDTSDIPKIESRKDFDVKVTLGIGSFGKVYLVKHLATNQVYAMKVTKKERILKNRQIQHIVNEKNVLKSVDHPFIVKFFGTFQDPLRIYIIMEYVIGGELFSFIRKAKSLLIEVARFYASEILLALEYLHDKNIVYRDLKPENILIGRDGHVKLADFGFAKHVNGMTKTLCGTPEYLAPEIIMEKEYDKSVDWYSFGILIYEMMVGYTPFENKNKMKLYESVVEEEMKFPHTLDSTSKSLIKSLCSINTCKRIGNLKNGVDDIKNHPWFCGMDWDALYNKQITPPYIPEVKNSEDSTHFEEYEEKSQSCLLSTHSKNENIFSGF